ncbi:MAG: TonB-dependent receptor [Saprospiraceae bacterium]|nr:TonB-dependent receptor [Saprospiraceae bacterium]MCF8250595.1 TonB-dependent receptor [Saprospiraceae bacterium]MCF8281411.1 TonB-dependent receptor [Bacteroidales bacterium]MCF8313086.1 TonB-dependent receptor [Saprospiraceae bacterium]MCF8441550.1 TonB-dependent receptor [Saprospiraceae bacterium]
MNKIKFTLTFVLAVLTLVLNAQNATLTGILIEKSNNSPLINATVQAGNEGTITDFNGHYKLLLPPGDYEVVFSFVGLETVQQNLTLKPGEIRQLDISLAENDNILSTATVTSGKHERALGEVTVSIDVLKPTLLENTNQTSLSGLLDKVPGVNLVGDQANIRGGSGFSYGAGSRVLLLVDDMPILQADAGYPQWEDVPLENIEQIEVVKGAASAMYGSSALNGIVNVRTAYAKAKPETKISPFVTSYGAPKNKAAKWWDTPRYSAGGSFSHKQKFGKLDLVTGGYYIRQESINDSTWSRRGRINIGTRYRVTDRLSVGLNTNFNKNKNASFFFWGGADSLVLRPGAAVSEGNNLRFNIDPYVTYYDPGNNRHKLMGRFYSVKNKTGTSEADQSNRSEVKYGEYQFQRKMDRVGLILTAGGVYIGTAVRAPLYGDTTFTSRNLAGYLQLDQKLFDRLNLSGGFRYEQNVINTPEVIEYKIGGNVAQRDTVPNGEIKESKPVFRFGASYEVGQATFLRASWGQGYRFPSIAEKFIFTLFGGTPILPNVDLNSETGWSAELGLRQGFKVESFSGFVDLAGFISEYQDMMEFNVVFQGFKTAFQSQNVGDTRIKGLEVSVTGKGNLFGFETTVLAGYTFIDPKFQQWASLDSIKYGSSAFKQTDAYRNAVNSSICSNGGSCQNILKYRYKHTAKVDIETKIGQFNLGVSAIYNSFMENIDAIFEAPFVVPGLRQFREENDHGDLILGARVAYFPSEKLKIALICGNLTNREYSARPGKIEATRNVALRMDYSF